MVTGFGFALSRSIRHSSCAPTMPSCAGDGMSCGVVCLLRKWALPSQLCSFAETCIGSHVRPSRQSRDCLRGRPFRTLHVSALLRSASGPVLPTVARGAYSGTSAHPHSASDPSFGVRLMCKAHMRPHGLGRNTSHKPCSSPLHLAHQPRLSAGIAGPVLDAPCPLRAIRRAVSF